MSNMRHAPQPTIRADGQGGAELILEWGQSSIAHGVDQETLRKLIVQAHQVLEACAGIDAAGSVYGQTDVS